MSRVAVDAILQPGPDKWLLWIFSAKDGTRLESEITPKILAPLRHVLLALPTRSILSVPLWVATEGDSTELAELELSSRHLLRKGAELHSLPVAKMDGRLLVLGLASTDDPEAAGYVAKAESYEFPARLLVADGADVLIWRELGDLCFGFYRNRSSSPVKFRIGSIYIFSCSIIRYNTYIIKIDWIDQIFSFFFQNFFSCTNLLFDIILLFF